MNVSLEAKDVSVSLGGRRVLKSVHLELRSGELVGLIGPNGAGKTTFIRTLLGLLRPDTGRVEVEGREAVPGRSPIGYVPQRHEFAWDFPISVEDVVMTGRAGMLGVFRRAGVRDWQSVDEALALVRMSDLRDRTVGELSGGQRQRVAVARALAVGSQVLLLDEPFTGLDIPTQDLLTELFLDLARDGHSVLMCTHDIASAIYCCDRLALLNGTMVAVGPPAQLSRDRGLWVEAFGLSESSPLMRVLEAV